MFILSQLAPPHYIAWSTYDMYVLYFLGANLFLLTNQQLVERNCATSHHHVFVIVFVIIFVFVFVIVFLIHVPPFFWQPHWNPQRSSLSVIAPLKSKPLELNSSQILNAAAAELKPTKIQIYSNPQLLTFH